MVLSSQGGINARRITLHHPHNAVPPRPKVVFVPAEHGSARRRRSIVPVANSGGAGRHCLHAARLLTTPAFRTLLSGSALLYFLHHRLLQSRLLSRSNSSYVITRLVGAVRPVVSVVEATSVVNKIPTQGKVAVRQRST